MRRVRIAAFGSSRTDLPADALAEVRALAKALAEQGADGLVGGHQGMMAAFAEGIRAGGGHVRGITLARFPTPPENALSEEVRARDFFDRMRRLIEEADGWLVLPGGLGTLAELAMSWDLVSIGVLAPRPLVLFGEGWRRIVDALLRDLIFSSSEARARIAVCSTIDEAVDAFAPLFTAARARPRSA